LALRTGRQRLGNEATGPKPGIGVLYGTRERRWTGSGGALFAFGRSGAINSQLRTGTDKGTDLANTAGKEDPVELDSSLTL